MFDRAPLTPARLAAALADGWFVMPHVNSRAVNGGSGGLGHMVVVEQVDVAANWARVADPGLPPGQARELSLGELFAAARDHLGDFAFSIALRPR